MTAAGRDVNGVLPVNLHSLEADQAVTPFGFAQDK